MSSQRVHTSRKNVFLRACAERKTEEEEEEESSAK